MSTAYTQDPHVTTLRETSSEIVCSWPAAVESWQGAEFKSFAELASAMTKLIIRVRGSIARVANQERTFGKVNHGKSAPFSALGVNIISGAATSGSSSITTRDPAIALYSQS